jgi:spore maturation protein CgeB
VPHAYDPTLHYRRAPSPDLVCDFGWVGTAYPSRRAFFEEVDWSGLDVLLGGNWQELSEASPLNKFLLNEKDLCLENSDTVDLYSSCKASANLYRKEAVAADFVDGWAMGPREVELAATGCFYLAEPRGENREVLPMVPTFDGPGDFADKLRWYLSHDDERDRVAAAAQAAIADRTFDNNARFLLERVEALPAVPTSRLRNPIS